LNDHRDPRSGYHINPAYDAFQLMSNIQGAKYAPAIADGSTNVKTFCFVKEGKEYLFALNLDKSATSIRSVTRNGAALKPVLKRAYWADKLSAARSDIKSIDKGDGALKPYSVSWFELQ
jgi:predicted nucleotidyltransferase